MRELTERVQWEREVIDLLIDKLDITNGDAQGIIEAHEFEMMQSWASSLSAEETAEKIASV